MPPLRKRPEDIPGLAHYFFERYASSSAGRGSRCPPATLDRLIRYSFPGNVRELENLIKRMIVLGDPDLATDAFSA